jgi:molecular chaperone DnaK
MRIVNEPTAAALATARQEEGRDDCRLRLRRGTFDISILEVGEGVSRSSDQRRHASGGRQLDQRIIEWIIAEFKKTTASIEQGRMALQRLKEAGRSEDGALDGDGERHQPAVHHRGSKRVQAPADELTRAKFEQLVEDFCRRPSATKQRSRMRPRPLEDRRSVLVGGSTRIPRAADRQGSVRQGSHKGVNPDEVVAVGALFRRRARGRGQGLLLLDVTPLSLGIETLGGVMRPLSAQHDDPDAQERNVLDGGRQPDQRRSTRAAGERPLARDNRTSAGSSWWHSAGAARRAAD